MNNKVHEKMLKIISHQEMKINITKWDNTTHSLEWLKLKRRIMPSAAEDLEPLELLILSAGKHVKWYDHFEKQFGTVYKINIHSPYDLEIPLLDFHPVEMKTYVHKGMLIEASFMIAKNWTQTKCPSTGELIGKLICSYNGILLSH